MVSAPARRLQVGFALGRGLSQRRACALLSVARSTVGYTSRMPAKDAPVVAALAALSAQYPRFGYRRMQIMLERTGETVRVDRVQRLWQQAHLQVPRRRPRRRAAHGRPRPPLPPTAPRHIWAYDFVFDTCANFKPLP